MGVKIITDSAADLPQDIIDMYSIEVIPLRVIEGEREYLDKQSIMPKDLFAAMRKGTVYKTSQPAYPDILECFRKYAESGQSCVYLAFSSQLSGTYQTALMVQNELLEQYPAFDLAVVDTKNASFGQGLTVLRAAERACAGATKAQILEAAVFDAAHMEHIFTVDDLVYLLRGGRVSPLAAFIGGILNIKPVLDVEEGKLIPIERVRGRKKAFQRMIDIMRERGVNLDKQIIGISHGDDLEAAEQVVRLIQENFGTSNIIVTMIGGAVGAHAGPGTLAIFFLNKEI
jgi:DegV family protein with EDD domain